MYVKKRVCACIYVPNPTLTPEKKKKKKRKKKKETNSWSLGIFGKWFLVAKKNFSPMLTGFPHEPSQARLMHRVSSVLPIGNTEIPGLLDTDCRSHGKPYQPCKQLGKPSDWSDQRTQLGHSNGLGQLGKIEGRSCWMLLPVRNMYVYVCV